MPMQHLERDELLGTPILAMRTPDLAHASDTEALIQSIWTEVRARRRNIREGPCWSHRRQLAAVA